MNFEILLASLIAMGALIAAAKAANAKKVPVKIKAETKPQQTESRRRR